MDLVTSTREREGVTIVTLEGRLCLGDDTRGLREKIKGLVDEGQKSILLEMEKLSYIDSAGLGSLIAGFSSARGGGGALKLLRPSKKVVDALTVTKMLPVFEVFEDEEQAVASFVGAAEA